MSDAPCDLDNTWNERSYQDDYGGQSWAQHAGQGLPGDLELSEIGDRDEDSGVKVA